MGDLDGDRQYRPNAVRSVPATKSRFSHADQPSSINKMFNIWPNKKAREQKQIIYLLSCTGNFFYTHFKVAATDCS